MCQQHTAAAISVQANLIQSFAFAIFCIQEAKEALVFVANNFSTGKAANRNDHLEFVFFPFRPQQPVI
eukprot:m.14171 g.14171  ORF g.14171 m.14171 type:complete len:68 (+) comp7532_c0_seq1:370-573(+)